MASDFAVFFRIDDPEELDGPRFFARAFRLPHYRGVIRDVWIAESEEQEQRNAPSTNVAAPQRQQSRENVSEAQLAAQLGGAPGWLERG